MDAGWQRWCETGYRASAPDNHGTLGVPLHNSPLMSRLHRCPVNVNGSGREADATEMGFSYGNHLRLPSHKVGIAPLSLHRLLCCQTDKPPPASVLVPALVPRPEEKVYGDVAERPGRGGKNKKYEKVKGLKKKKKGRRKEVVGLVEAADRQEGAPVPASCTRALSDRASLHLVRASPQDTTVSSFHRMLGP